jgi:hypothetical protein
MIADSSCKTLKIEVGAFGKSAMGLPSFFPKPPICPRELVVSFQILLMAKQV